MADPVRPDLEAIRRRWATFHDRGAHDYTDAGCRVLAEHAFTDIPVLLAALDGLAADNASLAGSVRQLLDYIGADPDDDADLLESLGAPWCVVSAVRALAAGSVAPPDGDTA